MATSEIVSRLWNLCHILRDDGVTYHQYVNELTYLLFLKMAQETNSEARVEDGRAVVNVPEAYRWATLIARDGTELRDHYRRLLVDLGSADSGASRLVQQIYNGASTSVRRPANLRRLVVAIDALDWYSAREEGLGDLYEGLLEKNATEQKSGAGQYFTPRPLIDAIVDCVRPQPGEVVQDPAAGTGGFLIAADRYIKRHTDDLWALPPSGQEFQRAEAFQGVELVLDTHRLCLMNLMLHDISGDHLTHGNSLGHVGQALPPADLILANPPFGTARGGGAPSRDDFTFVTSNKQLAFLQHIYRGLKPGGRAAVVLPDNVLFEENVGARIRRDLMDKCDLHTILRLPTGIFYAQGVKTNVLFFTRGASDEHNTDAVWFYDMRTNMPSFGKRTPLTRAHFDPFVSAYLSQPRLPSHAPDDRWRPFSRADLADRSDNLDLTWLRDDALHDPEDLPDPDTLAADIMAHLRSAMDELEALMLELDSDSDNMEVQA